MKDDHINRWRGDSVEIRNDGDLASAIYGVVIARKMHTETFNAVNLDPLFDPGFVSNSVQQVFCALGQTKVPLSFRAARTAGIEMSKMKVKYLAISGRSYYYDENSSKAIVSYEGRSFMTVGDKYWRGLVEIKNGDTTWDKAFSRLKPRAVVAWEKETGFTARRQGEWYIIPRPDMKIPGKLVKKHVRLSHGTHTATKLAVIKGKTYISGTLRHQEGVEKRSSWYRHFARPWLRMGKYWHEVHRANFIEAYK